MSAIKEGHGQLRPGGRLQMSAAERKLFPLPFFARSNEKVGVSRSVKKRRQRLLRMKLLALLTGWLVASQIQRQ